jgi:hypothetical protein
MASEIKDVEAGKKVLAADGILDNIIAGVKAPLTSADYVEVSVARAGMAISAVAGVVGGIAMESRGMTIPFVSDLVRPNTKRV